MSKAHLLQFKAWITKHKTEPLMKWFRDQKTPEAMHWKQLGEQVYLHHPKPMDFLLRFTLDYLENEQYGRHKNSPFTTLSFKTTKLPGLVKTMYEGLSDLRPATGQASWSLAHVASPEDKLRWTAQWMKHLDDIPPSVGHAHGLKRTFMEWALHERYLPIVLKHISTLDSIDEKNSFLRTYLRHGHPEDWPVIRQGMLTGHDGIKSFHQLLWMTSWQLLAVEPTLFPLVTAYFEWVKHHEHEYPPLMQRFRNTTSFSPGALTELTTTHGQSLDHMVLWTVLRSGSHHEGIVAYAQAQWDCLSKLTPLEFGRYKTMCIAIDMAVPVLDLDRVWLNSVSPEMTTYALPAEALSTPSI